MPILSCPSCGSRAEVPDQLLGKAVRCPKCGKPFQAQAPAPALQEARWYLAQGKQKLGPYPLTQLRQLAASGQLEPTDMLLQEGSPKWAPASSLSDLTPLWEARPAARPAAMPTPEPPQAIPLTVPPAVGPGSIHFSCPKCGHRLAVVSDQAGSKLPCPSCGQRLQVPLSRTNKTVLGELIPAPEPPGGDTDLRPAPASPLPVKAGAPMSPPVSPQAVSAAGVTVSNTVLVSVMSRPSNSLGIASLILGCVAFVVSLIPCLGVISLPLSAFGLFAGVVGMVIALIRKGQGIGFPLAGSAVSTLALVVGLFWLGLMGAASKSGDEGARRRTETNQVVVPNNGQVKEKAPPSEGSKVQPPPERQPEASGTQPQAARKPEGQPEARGSQPQPASSPPAVLQSLSAQELFDAYCESKLLANQIYNGKIIEVRGEVANSGRDEGGQYVILRATRPSKGGFESPEELHDRLADAFARGPDAQGVRCYLARGRAQDYPVGKNVTLRGRCVGMPLDVVLKDCVAPPGR